jgi:hypothetical protein
VASSSTGHRQLDELPCACIPVLLSGWKQSLSLHFATGPVSPEPSEEPAYADYYSEHLEPDMHFALLAATN